jgi:ATP-dependent Clp protease ATP-binding subunit ClpB
MTSNLGSDIIQQKAGEANYAEMKDAVMEIVRQASGRSSSTGWTRSSSSTRWTRTRSAPSPASRSATCKARLADRDMRLDISDAALDLLGEAGFDPVYGARPLKRAIRAQLENPLAQEILAGQQTVWVPPKNRL